MNSCYTVSATRAAEEAGAVSLAVASLPASFSPAPSGPALPATTGPAADVAVIAGESGWSTEAKGAIEAGARGVMVANPAPEDIGRLTAAADAAGAAVVLDHRWASNPALVSADGGPDAREAVRSALGTAAMLDSVAASAPGADINRLLGQHLAALLAVAGELDGVRVLRSDRTGYTFSGYLAGGAPFTAQGVLTAARPAGLDLRLYTTDGGVSVTVPDPGAAWPAGVRTTGPQGEVLLPTLYESAHRAAWRRLKGHLDSGTRPEDLTDFARLAGLYDTLSLLWPDSTAS